MRNRVRNIDSNYISIHAIDENDYIFTNQIKLYATHSIIQKWTEKVKKDEGYNSECPQVISPPSFGSIYGEENLTLISLLSPPSQESLVEQNPVENFQYSLPTQETFDENDGPFGSQYIICN
ncbi:uncharacterized protein LOC107884494 [Acyrthosiphon pisum]|uniref:Uncharacterized protein n=1 Tax=Acyrthosiphon pisum TaxID=7029 RepID=A0A8R2H8H3_ACYPI|nr:uncharacterized protein LOC107884494 [Acyrthosiphon pisum]|eukprot:XP_016662194.1 PREDICTED: uncharacterized protein LOC107884494 [Acyrthosiphon pisum]